MSEPTRVPLTVRLRPDDKDFFTEAAEQSGLEPSIAARQVLEIVINRLRTGGDFVDAVHAMKNALREHQAVSSKFF